MEAVDKTIEGNGEKLSGKKLWKPLKLEMLDVPSATQSGLNRLDPAEGFILYRPS